MQGFLKDLGFLSLKVQNPKQEGFPNGSSKWNIELKTVPSSFSRISISFNLEPSWTKSWNRLTNQLFCPCIPVPTLNNGQQGVITEQNSGVYFWGTRIIRPGWSGFYENASGHVMVFLTIFWSKILRNDSAQILDLLISEKMLFEHAPVSNFLLNVLRIFDFFRSKIWFRIIDCQNSVLEHSEIDVDFLLVERRILIGLNLGGP